MSTPIRRDDIQGILFHGYGRFHHASFLLLEVTDKKAARAFLAGLPLTSGTDHAEKKDDDEHVNVAVTHSGLEALGLPPELTDAFPRDYVEGLANERRSRLLGDEGRSHPSKWVWGSLAKPVDVVVLVYAKTKEGLAAAQEKYEGKATASGFSRALWLHTHLMGRRQEHFGFRDGIGQPDVKDSKPPKPGKRANPHNEVAPGEMLLGHTNEFGEETYVPGEFARDGTYLVLRQLEQDVAGFWKFCLERAGDPKSAIHLAARMVGRWPNGDPIVVQKTDPGVSADSNDDAFGYASHDPHGNHCPFGAHVRRSNPRDWGVASDAEASRRVVARHRIIRRGRAYGLPLCPDAEPETFLAALEGKAATTDGERGLQFLAFNACIEQQFEFVQQQWCRNPKFAGLANGGDPLIGNHRPLDETSPSFSIQGHPTPQRIDGLAPFVTVKGGAYFFMPTVGAIRSLG